MDKNVNQISLKEKYGCVLDIEEFIEEGYFICGDDYVDFLAKHGYDVVGYYANNNHGLIKKFIPFERGVPWLDRALILLKDNKNASQSLDCENVENNPLVKQISMSLTEFEIRTVLKYDRWEKVEKDNVFAYVTKGDVEKDLSMEWIKFLAARYLEYKQYVLERYKHVRINAVARKESVERLISQRIRENENELNEASKQQQDIIDKSDFIVNLLTNNR